MAFGDFYRGKKVMVTGNTGFKGSWLCKILNMLGADVHGYALEPQMTPNLYNISGVAREINTCTGDIRELDKLCAAFMNFKPEIVIHMAAQPIVRESYLAPVYTYDVNIMGTVNVLECVRNCDSVRSFLNVTTDKVYLNKEWQWGYRENEELKGYDPYSNSKSCSELVTYSYKKSFFKDSGAAVSTARAGNVIGGGDFAKDRIIPDCVRAIEGEHDIIVRNPDSIRPYQHVLEPLFAYLLITEAQYKDPNLADVYNVGPNEADCWTTRDIVELFCNKWNACGKHKIKWESKQEGGPHENNILKLDCTKIRNILGWQPVWDVNAALDKIVEWTDIYLRGYNIGRCMESQIEKYIGDSYERYSKKNSNIRHI